MLDMPQWLLNWPELDGVGSWRAQHGHNLPISRMKDYWHEFKDSYYYFYESECPPRE